MWFGKTRVKITGHVFSALPEAFAAVRTRFLDGGGTVELEHDDVIIGSIPIHRVMGRAYRFGTWYGRAPVRLKITVSPGDSGSSTVVCVECDLSAIEVRFRWIFAILSVIVILPLIAKGWRDDPALLIFLGVPYVICWGNFLLPRMVLPGKMRKFFHLETCWWDK